MFNINKFNCRVFHLVAYNKCKQEDISCIPSKCPQTSKIRFTYVIQGVSIAYWVTCTLIKGGLLWRSISYSCLRFGRSDIFTLFCNCLYISLKKYKKYIKKPSFFRCDKYVLATIFTQSCFCNICNVIVSIIIFYLSQALL